MLLGDGFEEIEAIAPFDLLRRAGAEVRVIAVHPKEYDSGGDPLKARIITGKNGLRVVADTPIEHYGVPCAKSGFESALPPCDALVIPGGPGVGHMRLNESVTGIVRELSRDHSRIIGAICAAPLILKDAGALGGIRHTAFPGCRDELPGAEFDKPVVRDGRIITGRAAGAATDFALALVAALWSDKRAAEIAREIVV